MESRIRLLTLVAIVPLLGLIALLAFWLYNEWATPSPAMPVPSATVPPATALPTYTPTPTETPVVIVIPTAVPPAATNTPAPTATSVPPTATAPPTETPVPTNTRVVPRPPTSTPSPTPTEIGGEYRFKAEGEPAVFHDRPCQAQFIIFGYVKGRDGNGLPDILMRFIPKYGRPPEFPAITRSAPGAGYYELTVGTAGNEWDIYLVDSADKPISPVVRFVLQQQTPGDCWWLLNWIER